MNEHVCQSDVHYHDGQKSSPLGNILRVGEKERHLLDYNRELLELILRFSLGQAIASLFHLRIL